MRAILMALAVLAPAAAFAQDADVAALRAQLRAAQDQIATDKAEIAQLRAAGGGASAQDLAASQSENAQLQNNLVALQKAANGAIAGVRAAAKTQAAADAARNDVCDAANQKLYATAEDILYLYQSQSFRGVLLKSYEPLLGLDKVKLENIIQDYDDKIHDHQIVSAAREQ